MTVTVVLYIAPDDAEVLQDILLYLEVAGGQVVPRLLLGKKISKMTNAIFFAGSPSAWRTVAQSGITQSLRTREVLPEDNFKAVKGEVARTFIPIANRVADRMAQGAHPSLNVHDSVLYDEPAPVGSSAPVTPVAPAGVPGSSIPSGKNAFQLLDESVDAKLNIGGMEVGSRKQLIALTYEQKLKALRDFGPKKIEKFWKSVEETIPPKEKYMSETNPMQLPVVIFAVPDLRADLLSFRGKGADGKEDFQLVEQYLVKRLAAASAALVAAKTAERPVESTPTSTEPTTFIEFPLNLQGAAMTCHIDFKEPVPVNAKDQVAVVKCVVEKLGLVQNFQFLVSGTEVFNRQKMRDKYLNEELVALKDNGPKKLDKYWKHVESLPSKETFEPGKTSFGLIFQLMATPTLRSDLLALRGKMPDAKEQYSTVENFLQTQLKG